jgi:hypothetical protein
LRQVARPGGLELKELGREPGRQSGPHAVAAQSILNGFGQLAGSLLGGLFLALSSRAFRWLYAPVDGYITAACRRAGMGTRKDSRTSEM